MTIIQELYEKKADIQKQIDEIQAACCHPKAAVGTDYEAHTDEYGCHSGGQTAGRDSEFQTYERSDIQQTTEYTKTKDTLSPRRPRSPTRAFFLLRGHMSTPTKIFSLKIPERDGWYWAECCNKWRRRVRRPCYVCRRNGVAYVHVMDAGMFTPETRKFEGHANTTFGPRIREPKAS